MEEKINSEKAEMVAEVVGFDFRKLWVTCRDLTVRPGETVAAYCDGARQRYLSPYSYFLLTFGINYFLTKTTGILSNPGAATTAADAAPSYYDLFLDGYMKGNPNATPEKAQKLFGMIQYGFEFMMSKEGMIITTLPIMVLLQWLFYRAYRKSFFQNFHFLLFVSAQTNLLTAPLVLVLWWSPESVYWLALVTMVLAMPFYFWAVSRFYPKITSDQIILRTFGQVLTGIIPYFVWSAVVMIAAVIINAKFFS